MCRKIVDYWFADLVMWGHRCTWVENLREGVVQVFAKSLGLRGKIAGGPPILGFIAFLLRNVLKFSWGLLYLHPSPLIGHDQWKISPLPTSNIQRAPLNGITGY